MPSASSNHDTNGATAPPNPSLAPARAGGGRCAAKYADAIEAYQSHYLKVLPLVGKSPVAKGWPTRDFTIDDMAGASAIGIQMGPTSGVIDFEYDSDAQLQKIYELFEGSEFLLDVCAAFSSEHGGHFIFKWDDRLEATNAGILSVKCDNGEKLLIRLGAGGKGSQSAFPPSPGKTWLEGRSILEVDSLELPDEVINRLLAYKRPPQVEVTDDPDIVATSEQIEACRNTLSDFDDAVDGADGHNLTLRAACEIRRSGIYGEQAFELLQWFNENKCFPSWDDDELKHKHDSARGFEPSVEQEFADLCRETGVDAKEILEQVKQTKRKATEYRLITSRELAEQEFVTDFAIADTLVIGQPLIVAGPQKALKTSILIDAAISLASGGHFLGKLKVKRPYRTLLMSGESGLSTLKETAERICKAAKLKLGDLDNLTFSPDLPKFGDASHAAAIAEVLQRRKTEMLIIEPAYLCMPGADAGNLFTQGEMLFSMSSICQQFGVTLVMAHHTKKMNDRNGKNQSLSLTDIAWAGFQEFARQWWLINRREPYVEGSGEHRMWLSIGGSAGHSALWGVDVSEGVRSEFQERHWDADVFPVAEAKERDSGRGLESDVAKVWPVLEAAGETGVTASDVTRATKDAGAVANAKVKAVFKHLAESGRIEPCEIKKQGRTYDGFRLTEIGS